MNEVEKQMLVAKLINGNATQDERDRALASVMLSLWGQEELKKLIRMVHTEECAKCPMKRENREKNEKSDWTWQKIAMTLLQYGGWLILIIAHIVKVNVQ